MAKLPKPPRSIPVKRAPRKPNVDFDKLLPRAQQPLRTPAPRLHRPEPIPRQADPTPQEAAKRVWKERPRLSDLQRLPEEELRSEQHQAKLRRWRQWPMFGLGLVAFGMGMYGTMLYVSLTAESERVDVPADVSDRFDREAESYDEKVDTSETMLLLKAKREKLTREAKGHVLEVAVGTGRNIPYYNTKQ